MSLLTTTFFPEITNAIFQTIIHSLWQIPIIALAIKLLANYRSNKDARTIYHANIAAIIISLVAAIFTFSFYLVRGLPTIDKSSALSNTAGEGNTALNILTPGTTTEYLSLTEWIIQYDSYIVMFWFVGVLFFLFRLIAGWIGIKLIKRNLKFQIPIEIADSFQKIRRKLNVNSPVKLALSSHISIPMVLGYAKPLVLLPLASINQLTTEEVEAIIAHELAHVIHHDMLKNLIIRIGEAIFFYHPVIWLLSSEIQEERENACDDMAMNILPDRISYARTLVKLGELYHTQPKTLTLTLFNSKFKLMKRIKRILNLQNDAPIGRSKVAITAILLSCLIVFSSAGVLQNLNNQENSQTTSDPIIILNAESYDAPKEILSTTEYSITDILSVEEPTILIEDLEDTNIAEKLPALPGLPDKSVSIVSPIIDLFELPALTEALVVPLTLVNSLNDNDFIQIAQDTLDPEEREKLRAEMRVKREELRQAMKEQREKLRSQREKVREEFREKLEKQRKELRELRKKLGEDRQSYNFDFDMEWSDEEKEEWAAKMQEWGEKFSEQFDEDWVKDMEQWGEEFSEKFDDEWVKDMEKWGEKFGKKMAKWGEQFGEDFGGRFGEEFDEEWLAQLEELGTQMEYSFDEDWLEGIASIGTEVAEAVREAMEDIDFDDYNYNYTYGDVKYDDQLKGELVDMLNKDGLLTDSKNTITITDSKMTVNGKSQSSAMLNKYMELIHKSTEGAYQDGKIKVKLKLTGKSLEDSKSTGFTIDIYD